VKILILGGTGMLGHKLWQNISTQTDTYMTMRGNRSAYTHKELFDSTHVFEGVFAQDIEGLIRVISQVHPQVIVNCIGIVKQQSASKDPLTSIAVNSLFPHQLANICSAANIRLIHISTDCVFSGRQGNYRETDVSDAEDLYGRTKYLGEVDQSGCLTIRTSMIGYELDSAYGLLEWFLTQEGKTVKGFTNAIFSGFTTAALSNIIWEIVSNFPVLEGVFHVASQPIDKFTLLSRIKELLDLPVTIVPDSSVNIDRSLNNSKFAAATGLLIPTWDEMLSQLANESSFYYQTKYQIRK
jgi:dTDP-4-dehydrorhamnose reductase